MDSLLRFASGLTTVESYARDVYVKSNLTIQFEKIIKQLVEENPKPEPFGETGNEESNRILIETPTVTSFCETVEAIFLHGLKERFSAVFHHNKNRPRNTFSLDFWPVIKILSHNEESKQLDHLTNISTDIGRCRAWIRLSLNECLLRSYLDCLVGDSSTLNSNYRSSAYLRDTQHTELMRQLISQLDSYIFHLGADSLELNTWSTNTLSFLGIQTIQSEDSYMVATALDAIHLISETKPIKTVPSNAVMTQHEENETITIQKSLVEPLPSTSLSETKIPVSENEDQAIRPSEEIEKECQIRMVTEPGQPQEPVPPPPPPPRMLNNNVAGGNSVSMRSGWSTQPTYEESYNALLESYSTRAVLSSTPDINDLKNSMSFQPGATDGTGILEDTDGFEVIPKNLVDVAENQRFFEQISRLAQELGLDEQDYKCHQCSRPIGMIYGRCMLCHLDGHLYCADCHGGEETIVPAQIIFNWSFRRYPVAKQNKARLAAIENEPIFDLKVLSPNLYEAIPEMAEVLDLRSQLFFLHAYLFTCQEQIALKMRKLVWPREHLFEHIHLYSINDLQQVYNNMLATTLRQVITFARKHIFGCNLCRMKGFYCEICKNSEILYPFDTDSTRRCDGCKSVFHLKCYEEKYDKNHCPKCLRLAKKRSMAAAAANLS